MGYVFKPATIVKEDPDSYLINGRPALALIHWLPDSQKWTDQDNNFHAYAYQNHWRVSARYGWATGDLDPKQFADERDALAFLTGYLYTRATQRMRSSKTRLEHPFTVAMKIMGEFEFDAYQAGRLRELLDQRFPAPQPEPTPPAASKPATLLSKLKGLFRK